MIRKTLIFLVIFSNLLLNCSVASGNTVVATPRTRSHEMAGYKRAFPQFKSYAEDSLGRAPSPSDISLLVETYSKAKKSFFSSSPEKAKKLFLEVLSHQHMAQWKQEHQYILFHSALRAFELSTKDVEKSRYLLLAAKLGHKLNIDRSVFSPGTVSSLKAARANLKLIKIPVTGWLKGFEFVTYNGQSIDLRDKSVFEIQEGEYLFGFHSSRFEAWETILNSRDLLVAKHSNQPLVGADCQLSKSVEDQSKVTVIDQSVLCGDRSGKKLFSAKVARETPVHSEISSTKSLTLTPTHNRPSEKKALEARLETPQTVTAKQELSPPRWWQNKWVWIGLSAVATSAYVIHQQNQNDGSGGRRNRGASEPTEDPTPTVSYERK